MKLKIITLTMLLFTNLISVSYADFNDGWVAYQKEDFKTAFNEWKPLAEQGDVYVQSLLGLMYSQGQGVSQDYKQAFKWLRKAANQGDAMAHYELGRMYSKGKGVPKDDEFAVYLYQKAAEQGYADAQYNLAWMYNNGRGVSQDSKKAVKWYQKAAEQGVAKAQSNLGMMYANGQGVPQDYKEAFKWYRKAADKGNTTAQAAIGAMYESGMGVSKDYKQAIKHYKQSIQGDDLGIDLKNLTVQRIAKLTAKVKPEDSEDSFADYTDGYDAYTGGDYQSAVQWWRKAAEQGDADAQSNLGVMYASGQGVPQDYKEAFKWYQKAAEQGVADAQFNLGVMYESGKGVLKDDEYAIYWLQKAANQGDAGAQSNLGVMYENGMGALKDDKQAMYWYQKAADQGDAGAQYNLGLIYEYGQLSVDKNYIIAIKYYKQSIQGNDLSIDSKNLAVQKIAKLTAKVKPDSGKDSFADLWQQYGGDKFNTANDSNQAVVTEDSQPPVIHITQGDNISIIKSQITLSGMAIDDSTIAELLIDGEVLSVGASGEFSSRMYIPFGENKFIVSATDSKGNNATKTITITRKEATYKNKDRKLIPPLDNKAHNPNAIALIIGIDKYEAIASAPWAESDAGMFYDFANKSLGIPTDRIKLIRGDKSDMRGIWKSVEQWLPAYVDKRKSDVYVYFAGHGLASEDGNDAYLIPWDGDPELLKRTALRRSEFIDTLKSLNSASVTLFMDTCYSGRSKGGDGVLVADARGLRIVKKNNQLSLPTNFTLFSAAASDETARSHPSLNHGLFSYWMMRGLSGEADSNSDNKLTNGELHSFISKKVQQTATSSGYKQHPQLVGDKDKVIASW